MTRTVVFFLLATAFIASPLTRADGCDAGSTTDCKVLAPVSEEGTSRAQCPKRFAVTGVKCEGRYCDNVTLTCRRYMADSDAQGQPVGWGDSAEKDWTAPFSEENGGRAPRTPSQTGLVSGVECLGSYCDSMRLRVFSPFASARSPCVWLDAVSEEDTTGASCPAGQFVNDMKCTGANCDNISVQCCAAEDLSDRRVVFASTPACVTLPRTGRGWSAMAEATPSGIPAKLGASRPEWMCPDGYAMRGAECHGDYCSTINATCCAYTSGRDNSKPTFRVAGPFSEEQPRRGLNQRSSKTEFVAGIRCTGDYCDNVELAFMNSRQLQNDSNACHTVGPISEESGEAAMCASYEFVAGVQCDGDYCDRLTLKCCRYSAPLPTQ